MFFPVSPVRFINLLNVVDVKAKEMAKKNGADVINTITLVTINGNEIDLNEQETALLWSYLVESLRAQSDSGIVGATHVPGILTNH